MHEGLSPEMPYFNEEMFEIRIQGHLHNRWSTRLYGMTVTQDKDGTTTLCGKLPDQTALHGILLQIRNMNLRLISVQRILGIEEDPQLDLKSLYKERIKSAIQKFHEEIWNQGNLSCWKEFISATYIEHGSPFGDLDFETAQTYIRKMHAAFPDRVILIEEIFVDEGTVVLRWKTSGTHMGEIFGIHPSGKLVKTNGCSVLKLEDGKVIEAFVYEDWLDFFQQLGLVACFKQENF